MPIKSIITLFFLTFAVTTGFVSSTSAGAKEAQFITSNGKWHFSNATGQGQSFEGTMRFDGKKTLRMFVQSYSVRGTYRVSGGTICMKVFRLWGKREKCGPGYKRGNTYYWGGLRLTKR